MKWSPQSPELNAAEHLWDVVQQKIHIMNMLPTNLLQHLFIYVFNLTF